MEQWLGKELELQGMQKFSSLLTNKMQIDKKSILDNCIRHITIVGATFFDKCWSTAILFSWLLEFEQQAMDKNYIRHLPHPLFLLLHSEPETYKYTLTVKQSINEPKDEYIRLFDTLLNSAGSYKLPRYSVARLYITVILELLQLFITHNPATLETKLFTYDKNIDCVSLHLSCSRHGRNRHYKELLELNLNLEIQLSNIVEECPYNKFNNRPKGITMEAFVIATFFNQRTNSPGNVDYDEGKQVIDKESQTTEDKPNVMLSKSIIEVTEITGNNSDSETSPLVTSQNIEEENNV